MTQRNQDNEQQKQGGDKIPCVCAEDIHEHHRNKKQQTPGDISAIQQKTCQLTQVPAPMLRLLSWLVNAFRVFCNHSGQHIRINEGQSGHAQAG